MSFVVVSKVKEYLRQKGYMTAGDLPESLSAMVQAMLDKGSDRASKNDRKTVRGYDL